MAKKITISELRTRQYSNVRLSNARKLRECLTGKKINGRALSNELVSELATHYYVSRTEPDTGMWDDYYANLLACFLIEEGEAVLQSLGAGDGDYYDPAILAIKKILEEV